MKLPCDMSILSVYGLLLSERHITNGEHIDINGL